MFLAQCQKENLFLLLLQAATLKGLGGSLTGYPQGSRRKIHSATVTRALCIYARWCMPCGSVRSSTAIRVWARRWTESSDGTGFLAFAVRAALHAFCCVRYGVVLVWGSAPYLVLTITPAMLSPSRSFHRQPGWVVLNSPFIV